MPHSVCVFKLPCWNKSHWYNGIVVKRVEWLKRHWHGCDAITPWPNWERLIQGRRPIHGQCFRTKIDSMFATTRCGSSWPSCWTRFEHFLWEPLALAHWMPKCVDRISENDRTPNCWPSKMIELVDLDCALAPRPKSNWPRDVKRRLIYVHVRLAANPVDNVLMHDI